MKDALAAGDHFLLHQARLLEKRLFATCFKAAPPSGVVDALRGYQNEDGGFGHALEPDTRCPASLPIYVEAAFRALALAGASDAAMVLDACDFLARSAAEAGSGPAVPLASPVIEHFPRAEHWTEWTYEPGLNPTAGLVGLLYQLGAEHPWREQAARYCWEQLEAGMPEGPHALLESFIFLEHVPEADRAEEQMAEIAGHLEGFEGLHLDPEAPGYGLSPLQFAPRVDSRWRKVFTAAQLSSALDHLEGSQQADGGWPIAWEPPSQAASLEWRGVVTLQALQILVSYGRVQGPTGA